MHLNFDLLHKNSHFCEKMVSPPIKLSGRIQTFVENVAKLSSNRLQLTNICPLLL